jgi:hypothetical protein
LITGAWFPGIHQKERKATTLFLAYHEKSREEPDSSNMLFQTLFNVLHWEIKLEVCVHIPFIFTVEKA